MKSAAISIFLRYFAIAIQFLIVVLIARKLPLEIAGQYLSTFGVVTVAFTISGLGLPDGAVKEMNMARAEFDTVSERNIATATVKSALVINTILAPCIGALAGKISGLSFQQSTFVAIWWFGYAGTFLFSQILVGKGKPALATFFAYSAINLTYIFTLFPTIIFLQNLTLSTTIGVASAASNLALIASAIATIRTFRNNDKNYFIEKEKNSKGSKYNIIRSNFSIGTPMMIARLAQASLPWLPVWMLAYMNSSESSAIYAAASRLTVAVTSVVAALRFSMRGEIVRANFENNFKELASINRVVSLISSFPPILGLIFLTLAGSTVIPNILGSEYSPTVPVLIVLMFGVLGEAFGGLSDEILKMTGRTRIVLLSLLGSLSIQFVFGLTLSQYGPVYLAAGTAITFCIQYLSQVIWLSWRTQIAIIPLRKRKDI